MDPIYRCTVGEVVDSPIFTNKGLWRDEGVIPLVRLHWVRGI